MSVVMAFEQVSKQYQLGAKQGSLRDMLAGGAAKLGVRGTDASAKRELLWALKDVTFSARRGDVLGIIGHNGAGKTTALKLLSGVTKPTAGSIDVQGRVSALIELGAGFHPDLTGRENVYLNGVILGMSRKEIDRRYSSIVEFAELARFMETPVKRYSSGMYARLGFSVAAHTDPDLLVVDEVLGVGDSNFQRKCYDFIHGFVRSGGKTAVFVSHNLFVVEQLCTDLIWLDGGQVVMRGVPANVLPAYFDRMEERALRGGTSSAEGDLMRLPRVSFAGADGSDRDEFATGEDMVVNVHYSTEGIIERPHFCLGIVGSGSGQPLFTASMLVDDQAPAMIRGEGVLQCRFESLPLMPRIYDVWGEVWGSDQASALVRWQKVGSFRVVDKATARRSEPGRGGVSRVRTDAPIRVQYQWQY